MGVWRPIQNASVAVPLAVAVEEAADPAHGILQVIGVGQEDDAQMVRMGPVEAAALDHQHLFLQQEFEDEVLVVEDRIGLGVQAGEEVHGRLGLVAGDARDGGQEFVGPVTLPAEATRGGDQILDTLITAKRGLDGVLGRHVGAQPHGGEDVQPLDVVAGVALLPGHDRPTGAVAAGAVVLGQAVEGHEQHVLRQGGDGGMGVAVIEDLVIDLVGVDDQLVLAGNLDDLLQQIHRIEGAGGIVGVDDDDGAGGRGDLGPNVVQVRQPARALVTEVVAGGAAGQGDGGGPEGIVRRRHQHLVAAVQQGLDGHHDQLGDPVADVDVTDLDPGDLLFLGIVHHRLAGGEQALGLDIARGVGEVMDDIAHDLVRGLEAEDGGVADVELDDAVALFLHLVGAGHHGAADVIADIGQLGGLEDGLHGGYFRLMGSRQ